MATKSITRISEAMVFKPLTIQGLNESSDVEKDPRIDGERIIGKVVGEMFAVNNKTRNGRWYSEGLWEKTIARTADRFPLFGTCGHDIEFTEENIKKGELTHKVTKMWISEDGRGMAEILIMGNEYGKNIYHAMKEGYPLAVSTRAYGDIFKGKGPGGSDLIDEDSFYLETIDFVNNPGWQNAYPKVTESQQQEGTEEKHQMDEKRLTELLESLNKEKVETTVSLREALVECKALNEKVAAQSKILEAVQERLGSDPVKSLDVIEEGLRKWLELEPFKSFAKSSNIFGKTTEVPMQAVLEHLFRISEKYAAVGTPEALVEAKELNEKYTEYGTLEQCEEAYVSLKGFSSLRKSPAQIKKLLERAEKLISVYRDAKIKVAANQISAHFKVNKSAVTEMLKKDSAKNVISNLRQLHKVNESAAAKTANSRVANGTAVQGKPVPLTEKKEESGVTAIFESVKKGGDKTNDSKAYLANLTRARK